MLQFFCQDDQRLGLVRRHATLNAIDFLEVVDADAPTPAHRQRTLLVWCVKPVPATLGKAHVLVEGGVRRKAIRIEWAHRADAVPPGVLTPDEATFVGELEDPGHVLVVRTDVAGDFSTYRLALRAGPGSDAPPAGFDPVLSSVPFSFKVECPSGFDCAPRHECPPAPLPSPSISYLAKDYASFRGLMLDRLATVSPGWKERNPADVGVALVELLAYEADQISYLQDAVATEAYLGTARRRSSVRRHARLLDYAMHDGVNARAWIAVEVGPAGDGATLLPQDAAGKRAVFLTRATGGTYVPDDALPRVLAESSPEVFEPLHPITLFAAHNRIRLYAWGDAECCLPRGATRATLRDDGPARLVLAPGDVLVLEEALGPRTGLAADADPARRHAVRLTRVDPPADAPPDGIGPRTPGPERVDPLAGVRIVDVEWDEADALPFPLCVSTRLDGAPLDDVSVATGNVLLADHGRTLPPEPPAPDVAPEGTPYRPRLPKGPVTHAVPFGEDARDAPASRLLAQDPAKARPSVRLTSGAGAWSARRDLLGSDAFARDFVLEAEEDGSSALRFGDDVLGRAPEPGEAFTAIVRVGNGEAGNVGAESIVHVATGTPGIARVRNPFPARGGVAPEPMERVRLDAPQAFRTQERAVTEADWAAAARKHDDVQAALATRRWTGSWHTWFLSVDRRGGRPVDEAFEEEMEAFLDRHRLAGYDVEVEPPRLVPLDVVMTVCVKDGYARGAVREALLEAFSARDLAGGRRGFFHPDNFTFGTPVHLSRLVAAAMEVPGVRWVDAVEREGSPNRFRRWGEPSRGESEEGLVRMERLEIARLDNDPDARENGRIDFVMEGGL